MEEFGIFGVGYGRARVGRGVTWELGGDADFAIAFLTKVWYNGFIYF